MKKIKFLLLLIFLPILSWSQGKLEKHINRFVKYEVNFDKNPGVIIGVIEGDSTYVFSYGETKRGNKTKPTEATQFEIGSFTKVFTAALFQKLQHEGLTSFTNRLGYYYKGKEWKKNPVTVYDLLTHQSGLPRLPYNFGVKEEKGNPYANYTDEDLLLFLKEYQHFKKSNYAYSHINYGLLTQIAEKITNQSYEEALKTHVLTDLNLTNTHLTLSEEHQALFATGYSKTGIEAKPWTMKAFEGSGGLKSSMADLLPFLRLQLDDKESEMGKLFQAMHEPQCNTEIPRIEAGLGWHLVKIKRYPYKIIGHTGATNGHQIYMGFIKETRTGVVVLSNSESNLEDLGYYILKMINFNWRRKRF